MHRGSSKGSARKRPDPETLPLSASRSSPMVSVRFDVARGRRPGPVATVSVPAGTRLRDLLRAQGYAPEGSAVLLDGQPVPLDTKIERPVRFTVVPTFSGG
jgi:sulfur carrier protein ThiS